MKSPTEDPQRLLRRLAADIDGILDAEMSTALQDAVETPSAEGGRLADADVAVLLGRMFVEGRTGRLTVRKAEVEKLIYFESGLPVMAASSDAADRMLAMLVRDGSIDARQKAEVERVVDASGRRVGAVLVDLAFLRSDELLPAVRRHYESIILSLFAWREGQWHFDAELTAGPERTRLLRHPAEILREGLTLDYPSERLAERLGSSKSLWMLDNSSGVADLTAHVVLQQSEMRIPLLFDGIRNFEEVLQASGLSETTVRQVAYTLLCFGALHAVDAMTPPLEAGRAGLRDLSLERSRVESRYALALESDYFRMLGVDRRADVAEVERAYARLSKEFSPESIGPALWHEMREAIEIIQVVLDEGLRILTTPSLRSAYEFNISHGPDVDGMEAAETPSPSLAPSVREGRE